MYHVSCILQVQKHPERVCLSFPCPSREGVSRTALHDHSMHSTARSVASLGPWQHGMTEFLMEDRPSPWEVYMIYLMHTKGPHGLQRNQPYFCCHNHLRLTGLNCCLRWYLFPTALWLKCALSFELHPSILTFYTGSHLHIHFPDPTAISRCLKQRHCKRKEMVANPIPQMRAAHPTTPSSGATNSAWSWSW